MRTLALIVVTGAASIAAAAGAQAPSPGPQATFRSAVDLVDVEVSVLDRHRLPVRGLTAADFTLLEEGRARPIVAFAPVDLPTRVLPSAPWMDDVAPDVHSNEFPREGRLVAILLDVATEAADALEARRIAEAAVEELRDGDMAAIAWTLPGMPQNFTADRQRLLDVIRRPVLNVSGAAQGPSGFCPCGAPACALEAIASIAEGIQEVRWRRKIVIYIGRRLPNRGAGGCGAFVEGARRRAMRAAEAGNVTIHVLDPHGLTTPGGSASERGAPTPVVGAEARRRSGLLGVTEPTGGRVVSRNQASEAMPEVFRESDSYYVLGFEPAYTGTDGRFRRITVKLNRPDVTLQARRGYYAAGRPVAVPRGFDVSLPRPLVNAIAGLWPATDLPIALVAAPVAVPGSLEGTVIVLSRVRQDPQSIALPLSLGSPFPQTTSVSVLTGAFDSNGRSVALDRQTSTVTPRRSSGGTFAYELASRLTLKPGRYEIRTAVEDATLGRTGSAYTYVDVPDFSTAPIALSGMFVETDSRTGPLPGARVDDLVPVSPTARRSFARTETVRAFVQEYQSSGRRFGPGYALVEVFDDRDTRVYQQERRLVAETFERQVMNLDVEVPVDRLSPGAYVLRFEVRHGNDRARRDLRFVVE